MVKKFILIGACCFSLLATNGAIAGSSDAVNASPKGYDEKREEALKIQKERAERRHQMDLELIDRGASPEQVQRSREERQDQERMRQMQMEIDRLKSQQRN